MEVFILIALILCNGLFAMSEMSLVSAKKIKLQKLADDGNHAATDALYLSTHNGMFLSTVQVGITIIGIMNGAFGEDLIGKKLESVISNIPYLTEYSKSISTILFIVSITFTSILFGELLPKRIALTNPEKIALIIAKPMRLIASLFSPFVKILNTSSDFCIKLLGTAHTQELISEEEINGLMEQGTEAGIFEEHEQNIVSRVFNMDDRNIKTLMTPRSEIMYVNLKDEVNIIRNQITSSRYSRFIVCEDNNLDNIIGIIHAKKLLNNNNKNIKSLLEKPLYVPETLNVTQLIHAFKQHKKHIALIVDEYGQLVGLVTMYDVIEALLGDIISEDIDADPNIIRRDQYTYLLNGQTTLEELISGNILTIKDFDDIPDDINTIGGLIMSKLGKIPRATEYIETTTVKLEIMDMDNNRIDKILMTIKK